MKVALFIASDEWGGAENIFISIANEMSKSHEITVFLIQGNVIESKFAENVTVEVLASNPSRLNPSLYLDLIKAINRCQPDIINSHGAKAAQIMHRVRICVPTPHVATKHNSRKGRIFNRLRYVTTVSEAAAKSITHDNVRIIFNGLVPQPIKPNRSDTFTIRAIGRLEEVKRYNELIGVAAKLNFPFSLEIVGEGTEHGRLQELIDKSNSPSRIELMGYQENVGQLICDADLVVICSKTEGFSLVLIESLFYANVLISTHVGGSTEVLGDEFLFDLVDMEAKITSVYDNYKQYEENFSLLKKAHQGRFILSQVVKDYISYYSKVLSDA